MVTPSLIQYLLRDRDPPAVPMADYVLEARPEGHVLTLWADRLGPRPTEADLTAAAASPEYAAWLAQHTPGSPATLARETAELAGQPAPVPLSILALGEYVRQAFASQRLRELRQEARAVALAAAVRRLEAQAGLSPATVPDEGGIPVPPETSREAGIQAWAQIAAALAEAAPMGYVQEGD